MSEKVILNGEEVSFSIVELGDKRIVFELEGELFQYHFLAGEENIFTLKGGGKILSFPFAKGHGVVNGKDFFIAPVLAKKAKGQEEELMALSPMPGKILKVAVEVGEKVAKGQGLVVMEAMKMEHEIVATKEGVVKNLPYRVGETVPAGAVLVELE